MSQIGQQVCEALGINAGTVSAIDIAIRPNNPAMVTVTCQVFPGKGEGLIEVLKCYKLVESDEPTEESP